MKIKNKFTRIDESKGIFINMRPYKLVHAVKRTETVYYVDDEGFECDWHHTIRTYCGKPLPLNKWTNTRLSIDSLNCDKCKTKLIMEEEQYE